MQAQPIQIPRLSLGKGWHSNTLTITSSTPPIQPQQLSPYTNIALLLKFNTNQQQGQQNNKQKQSILPTLIQLRWNKLISLSLENNRICSIQCIYGIEGANLKQIRLCNNLITCIKSLRKGYWPKLQFLALKNNIITQHDSLTHTTLPTPFQSLTLSTRRQKCKKLNRSIEWISKLQPKQINNINIFIRCQQGYIENRNSSLEKIMGNILYKIKDKYGNGRTVFDDSNCYDL